MIGQRVALRLPRAKPTRGSQAFELAHFGVGALEDRLAAGELRQGIQDRVAPALDARGEELRDQHVGVAVDHQARQAVGFAVHQAQRIGVLRRRQRVAQGKRLLDPIAEESRVDGFGRVEGPDARADLRLRAVRRVRQHLARAVAHLERLAGRAARLLHRAGEDPGMAAA